MIFSRSAHFSRLFGGLAKTVFVDSLEYLMGQRAGIKRPQQVVIRVIERVISREPKDLFRLRGKTVYERV